MKKIFTLILLGAAIGAYAERLTPDQALSRLNADGPRRVAAVGGSDRAVCVAATENLYVFTSGTEFLILPADDIAWPLLAYGPAPLASGNPTLQWWLAQYDAEISAALDAPATERRAIMRRSRRAIAPMIATRWNQGAPYNDLCPTLGGERCVTGCVATAMAQAMRFHSWPAQGSGTHSYSWSDGNQTLSFDYGATKFDFAAMPDEYGADATGTQKTAVATLMFAAGVSVDMEYTPTESGAVSRNMGRAFLENFGYDQGLWMPQRDYYGLTDWEEMIYSELAEGRPVIYGGTGAAGGHQFIADGYSSDGFFHFNWGWAA